MLQTLYEVSEIDLFLKSPKAEVLLSTSFFNVFKLTCLDCSAKSMQKKRKKLYQGCVEHKWSDKNSPVKIHLDQCDEVQCLLSISILGLILLSDDDNTGSTNN